MQRKEEILAKKAKLAELRRQRDLREKEFTAGRQSLGSASPDVPRPSPARSPARLENKAEVDSLVASLIGDESTPRTPPSYRHDRSRPSSYVPGRRDAGTPEKTGTSPQVRVAETVKQTLSLAPLRTVYEVRSEPPKKEVIMYSKGSQTSPIRKVRSRSGSVDSSSHRSVSDERTPRRRSSRRLKEEEIREQLRKEIEEEVRKTQEHYEGSALADVNAGQHKFPARALTQDEKEAVIAAPDFMDFVERSSKVIERALDEEYDLLADYRLRNSTGVEDEDEELGATGRKGRRVREVLQFYDDRWSRRRIISDIGFSPKFPELVLSSHTKNPSAPYDPPGLILIWNTHMHSRPEYIFHANSDILTAKFSPFHPSLILGGTYSGQVLIWDTRSRTSQHHPVQKTPLTGTGFGHTHPIYSINIVGTQNAHNIISTSTDGIVCSWSVDMLSHPQEYLELSAPPPPSTTTNTSTGVAGVGLTPFNVPTSLSPTTTAFPPTDPSYFLAGTESGPIHLVHRYDRAGTKAGVDQQTAYTGHAAPVMSLDFHKATGPLDLGDLLLSTGLDWSVRLWRVRTPGGFGAGTTAPTYNNSSSSYSNAGYNAQAQKERRDVTPLLTLPRDEPVYDAKWSPVRPGVWACVDGSGHLEVWDMNHEVSVPTARVMPTQRREDGSVIPRQETVGVPTGAAARLGRRVGPDQVGRSLNKLAWENGEGKRIATGGLDGVVTLFEVGAELGGLEGVKQEEWMGVKKLVARLEGGAR